MSLYHQWWFAKLGYSAASILTALPLLQMLLLETEKYNLFVKACQMYFECKFFIKELYAFAYFTHSRTLVELWGSMWADRFVTNFSKVLYRLTLISVGSGGRGGGERGGSNSPPSLFSLNNSKNLKAVTLEFCSIQ